MASQTVVVLVVLLVARKADKTVADLVERKAVKKVAEKAEQTARPLVEHLGAKMAAKKAASMASLTVA